MWGFFSELESATYFATVSDMSFLDCALPLLSEREASSHVCVCMVTLGVPPRVPNNNTCFFDHTVCHYFGAGWITDDPFSFTLEKTVVCSVNGSIGASPSFLWGLFWRTRWALVSTELSPLLVAFPFVCCWITSAVLNPCKHRRWIPW